MKISVHNKIISGVLSLSLMLSLTSSICSMSTMEEMCDEMMNSSMTEMMHSDDHSAMTHDDSPSDATDCEMSIDCDCTLQKTTVVTFTPNVILKTNIIPIVISSHEINSVNKNISSTELNLSTQNSYSPPPLFLANESFLI